MPAADAATVVTHANGLRLALPPGFAAREFADGFTIEPDPPAATRSPVRITAALLSAPRVPAEGAATREAPAGTRWHYALQRADAVGSGGAEATLTACRSAGARWLCLWQMQLVPAGREPEFELWRIAAGASAG